jgi:outer membrane immunogenic protein
MKLSITFLFLITLGVVPVLSQTQASAIPSANQTEISGEYTYTHSNAPPAECGCFPLNGGSASIAQPYGSGYFALVFDTTVVHTSGISSGKYNLTLSVFTAGFRLRPTPGARWKPFGEVLIGVEHAGGSLVRGDTPAASDGGAVFAMNAGGGLDRRLSRHLSLRVIEADYLMTTSSNRANNVQNNLRIGSGLIYRFGR